MGGFKVANCDLKDRQGILFHWAGRTLETGPTHGHGSLPGRQAKCADSSRVIAVTHRIVAWSVQTEPRSILLLLIVIVIIIIIFLFLFLSLFLSDSFGHLLGGLPFQKHIVPVELEEFSCLLQQLKRMKTRQ